MAKFLKYFIFGIVVLSLVVTTLVAIKMDPNQIVEQESQRQMNTSVQRKETTEEKKANIKSDKPSPLFALWYLVAAISLILIFIVTSKSVYKTFGKPENREGE